MSSPLTREHIVQRMLDATAAGPVRVTDLIDGICRDTGTDRDLTVHAMWAAVDAGDLNYGTDAYVSRIAT